MIMNTAGFQRVHDPARVKEIARFLDDDEYPFFPNSIIVTCEIISIDGNNQPIDDSEGTLGSALLKEIDGKFKIYLPHKNNSILVIDGQHRLEGLKRSGTVKENYDLIISFILDFDRSVIAKLFYTINYTQKSVNKSLLYHLTGEFSRDLDEITFLHKVIKVLNERNESPFFKRIKMLGSTPKTLPVEDKRLMTISQAFLIDYLLYSIKDRQARSISQPIFKYYYDNDKYEIVRFLISYFVSIRKIFPEWDNPDNSILSKTIGVGALLKLMNFIFIKIFFDEHLDKDPMKIQTIKSSYLTDKLKGIEKVNLSQYSGTSSAGTVNQLKALMIENIDYFKCDDYSTFENNFKNEYSLKFQQWLSYK